MATSRTQRGYGMNEMAGRASKRDIALVEVKTEIEGLSGEFAALLARQISPDRFLRVLLTAVENNPDLWEADRHSLIQACIHAAQDQLLPDGREGALISRFHRKRGRRLVTWQPMVAGLIAKAKRRGAVRTLSAQLVYRGEKFRIAGGDDERIEHEINPRLRRQDRDVIVAYAIATMKDGSKEREWMTRDEIEQVRSISTSPETGPWSEWWGEMAKKSVIRRLIKRIPALDEADEELRRAIDRVDDLYEFKRKDEEAIEGEVVEEPPPSDEPEIGYINGQGRFFAYTDIPSWVEQWRERAAYAQEHRRFQALRTAWERNGATIAAVGRIDPQAAADVESVIRRALAGAPHFLPHPSQEDTRSASSYVRWFERVVESVPAESREAFFQAQEEWIEKCRAAGEPWRGQIEELLARQEDPDEPTDASSEPAEDEPTIH